MAYVVYFVINDDRVSNEYITAYTSNESLMKRYVEFVIHHSENIRPVIIQCKNKKEVEETLKSGIAPFGEDSYSSSIEDFELTVYHSQTRKDKCAIMTPYYAQLLRERFEYDGGFSSYLQSRMLSKLGELLRRYYKSSDGSSLMKGLDRIFCYLAAYDYIEENFDDVLNGYGNTQEILYMTKMLNLDIADICDADYGYGVIDYNEYTDGFIETIFM